jgi:hypothetical protein
MFRSGTPPIIMSTFTAAPLLLTARQRGNDLSTIDCRPALGRIVEPTRRLS